MWQHLSKLTGYDSNPDYFTGADILKEANRKFASTYLIINDNLEYVLEFRGGQILVDGATIETVRNIQPWMPEAGIYKCGELSHIYLHRLPKRQWLKSFSLNNNYAFIEVNDHPREFNIHAMYEDWRDNTKQDRNWMFKHNYLIYKFHVVGKVDKNNIKIEVTDSNFLQEILDKWNKHFAITLTGKPLGQDLDANLNTPNW